jgi:hypothetical protein
VKYCPIYNATVTTTHESLQALNDEINGNVQLLKPYHAVAADAKKEKLKQSHYTPWWRFGGEEV